MKISKSLIVTVCGLVLACAACNKGNKVVVETKAAPTTPVALNLKWPLGRHGFQSFDFKVDSETTVPGMPQPMTQEMNMGQESALTVIPDADGIKRDLEMEYTSVRMSMTMAGRHLVSFDSDTSTSDTNPAAATLGKMIGVKIRFVLDASNQVESVEGVDELLQRMTGDAKIDPTGMIKNMFTPDVLKKTFDYARNLPEPGKAVQPGDTWPIEREFAMGPMGTLVMDFTNTLTSWEKHGDRFCAKIDFEGSIKSKPGETPGVNGMSFSIHDGTCSGETWFDLDMGMFVDGTMHQNMKMDITVPVPASARKAGGAKTMSIQSSVKEVITTKFELE